MTGILAFIPARKGSKGLPSKNTMLFAGKPLIAHTIEVALKANVDDIFISTDDPVVLDIAKDYGIEVSYFRPPHLASDEAGMTDVISHGLDWRNNQGKQDVSLLLLQATSPLRTVNEVNQAVKIHQETGKPVFGVSPMWTHPTECIQLENGQSWRYLVEPSSANRRQDYKGSYQFINGAIYLATIDFFNNNGKLLDINSIPFIMNAVNTIDIDNEMEFFAAEALCGLT